MPLSKFILSWISQYGELTPEAQRDLLAKFTHVEFKKGDLIVREGQSVFYFYIIQRGMVRSFHNKDGNEVTMWFAYEGHEFASISSYYECKPSRETIQCLEDTTLFAIADKDMQELCERHNDISTMFRRGAELYCVMLDKRCFELQTQSAVERYKTLLNDEPEVIKRAPLGYIASYLGITQETLSRVRRK